ncbi:hypothetical protein [Frankia sp. CiP1_Cm_nod2]
MVFEIHCLDGEQSKRLGLVQARAIHDVLAWIAQNRLNGAAPDTSTESGHGVNPALEADPHLPDQQNGDRSDHQSDFTFPNFARIKGIKNLVANNG